MKKAQTHRSKKGPKLHAILDEKGRFEDIVEYQQKHRKAMKRKGKKPGAK